MKLLRSLTITLGALTVSATAGAEPVRLLIAAGSNDGLAAEQPLKFASSDAARVSDVFTAYGSVRKEHAFVLKQPTRQSLFSTIDRARSEAEKRRPEEVTLILYFSGHGDKEALHLGDERVPLAELSGKLAEVPAALRIVVTDACRATREKGFALDEPFAINAATVPQARGQVWLHASSDGEAAQESDSLSGAIFTHAWLSGLRGAADANGDARVTLEESFAFAHVQTLVRSAKSSGVLQKPEAVVNLREAAPLVLTETSKDFATLTLPRAKDTHYLVYAAGAKSVLSELWGSGDRRIALRVPAGRYSVHKRLGGTGRSAEVTVAEGEERKLEETDFLAQEGEALARKGDNADRVQDATPRTHQRHDVAVGYASGVNDRTGFAHGPRLGYAHAWGRWALALGVGLDVSARDAVRGEERLSSWSLRLGPELRLPLAGGTLRLGAGVAGAALDQTVAEPGKDTRRLAWGMGPDALAAFRIGLPLLPRAGTFVDVGAGGTWLFLFQEGSLAGIAATNLSVALGASF